MHKNSLGIECKGICAEPYMNCLIEACGHKSKQADGTYLCYFPSGKEDGYMGADFFKYCGSCKPLQMELKL